MVTPPPDAVSKVPTTGPSTARATNTFPIPIQTQRQAIYSGVPLTLGNSREASLCRVLSSHLASSFFQNLEVANSPCVTPPTYTGLSDPFGPLSPFTYNATVDISGVVLIYFDGVCCVAATERSRRWFRVFNIARISSASPDLALSPDKGDPWGSHP
jgi:hypothetical protein